MSVQSIGEDMSQPTKREQQAEQRRVQLLDITLDLFAQKGVENTTIKDIASKAGVAQGLVYHYFESKDALLIAVIERYGPVSPIREFIAGAYGRPASEVLPQLAYALYALGREREKLLRIVLREALTRPEMRAIMLMVRGQGLAIVGGYVRSRIEAGELRPHNTDVTVQTIAISVFSLILLGLEPEPYLNELLRTVLCGISADADTASE